MALRIRSTLAGLSATLWLLGCGEKITAPLPDHLETATAEFTALAAQVRQLATAAAITPLQRPAPVRRELSVLGQALAFDKTPSGNRDIWERHRTDPRAAPGGQGVPDRG